MGFLDEILLSGAERKRKQEALELQALELELKKARLRKQIRELEDKDE